MGCQRALEGMIAHIDGAITALTQAKSRATHSQSLPFGDIVGIIVTTFSDPLLRNAIDHRRL
jgi:hypothetical protein